MSQGHCQPVYVVMAPTSEDAKTRLDVCDCIAPRLLVDEGYPVEGLLGPRVRFHALTEGSSPRSRLSLLDVPPLHGRLADFVYEFEQYYNTWQYTADLNRILGSDVPTPPYVKPTFHGGHPPPDYRSLLVHRFWSQLVSEDFANNNIPCLGKGTRFFRYLVW